MTPWWIDKILPVSHVCNHNSGSQRNTSIHCSESLPADNNAIKGSSGNVGLAKSSLVSWLNRVYLHMILSYHQ